MDNNNDYIIQNYLSNKRLICTDSDYRFRVFKNVINIARMYNEVICFIKIPCQCRTAIFSLFFSQGPFLSHIDSFDVYSSHHLPYCISIIIGLVIFLQTTTTKIY